MARQHADRANKSGCRERIAAPIFATRSGRSTYGVCRVPGVQGQEPPLVPGSDRDMVAFVARIPGAIGYVAAGTP